MKVVLLNNTLHNGDLYEAGEVLETEAESGEALVNSGAAYEFGKPSQAELDAEAEAAAKAAAEAADEAARAESSKAADVGGNPVLAGLLDGNVDKALDALGILSDDELGELLALETGGKNRKGVIEGIEAEQAKRAD